MLSTLLNGTLAATPVRRTSDAGRIYATALVRVPTDDEPLLCSVIAFDGNAVDALLVLDKGDGVAVSGTAKLSRWTGRDGIEHTGLSVTAHRVMSAYIAMKKRRAVSEPEMESAS